MYLIVLCNSKTEKKKKKCTKREQVLLLWGKTTKTKTEDNWHKNSLLALRNSERDKNLHAWSKWGKSDPKQTRLQVKWWKSYKWSHWKGFECSNKWESCMRIFKEQLPERSKKYKIWFSLGLIFSGEGHDFICFLYYFLCLPEAPWFNSSPHPAICNQKFQP